MQQDQEAMSGVLPAGFRDLEKFINWSIPQMGVRQEQCAAAPYDDMSVFYDAVFPRIVEIIDYLDQFPVGALPPSAEKLANMALSLANVAIPVELYHTAEVPFCTLRERMPYLTEISGER
jgi:hypothetical protein